MFIDTGSGLSLNLKHIQAVEDGFNQMNCVVYMADRSFEVPMPREWLVDMIEMKERPKELPNKLEKMMTQLYQSNVTPRP